MDTVGEALEAIGRGDPGAPGLLLPLVYDELRRLAAARLAREQPGQTLQPTALVHEAYLRVAGEGSWDNRGHFFAAAAEAMRRILVERARRRSALKRGGGAVRVEWDDALAAVGQTDEELLALDEALAELERHDERGARLVKMRYFSGMSHQEAAEALGLTRREADRVWAVARAWLYRRLHPP